MQPIKVLLQDIGKLLHRTVIIHIWRIGALTKKLYYVKQQLSK
jgi:hypothetical protein